MQTVAIIVSAGRGKRFEGKIPKQYVTIDNKPVLYYTLSVFNGTSSIDGIILVSARNRVAYCRRLINRYNLEKVFAVVAGGTTRAHSVYNALKAVPREVKVILVHDGVRPLVKKALIAKVITAVKKKGAVITAVAPKDTIKEVSSKDVVKKTFNRRDLISAQTPQGFRPDILAAAYKKFRQKLNEVTDDSSLAEKAGFRVKVIKGDCDNIKITTREDLEFARNILGKKRRLKDSAGWRIGVGYDIHRLARNRKLVLGGVDIKSEYGLAGHSDADVLLHAITDALLGAAACRDIGWYFSPYAEKYKNKASKYFLRSAKKKLAAKRYRVRNIDCVIIAQQPKLQPYYNRMVGNIAEWLDISRKDITVKFTTAEELGPLGDKKAIACLATAGISRRSNNCE